MSVILNVSRNLQGREENTSAMVGGSGMAQRLREEAGQILGDQSGAEGGGGIAVQPGGGGGGGKAVRCLCQKPQNGTAQHVARAGGGERRGGIVVDGDPPAGG